jgi:hypothetical protein
MNHSHHCLTSVKFLRFWRFWRVFKSNYFSLTLVLSTFEAVARFCFSLRKMWLMHSYLFWTTGTGKAIAPYRTLARITSTGLKVIISLSTAYCRSRLNRSGSRLAICASLFSQRSRLFRSLLLPIPGDRIPSDLRTLATDPTWCQASLLLIYRVSVNPIYRDERSH